jgi:antitoxin (DNA-binding transcriptional repressor) of toxin-antitoxin stability system
MQTISISEAKARLTALVREVAASGEAFVISVNGEPVAELRAFAPAPQAGRFKGAIRMADDAFEALGDDEADTWGV